jgi:FkbM family methyltransferase
MSHIFNENNQKSYSQLGQDLDILKFYNNKRDGYFVEIGAYNGIELSNTYLLETQYNWKGICSEPIPKQNELLTQNRKNSHCDNNALYSESGLTLTFDVANDNFLSGISNHIDKHTEAVNNNKTQINVTTITLTDLLDKYNAPSFIEYLSIDTEGTELEILKGCDFNKYKFGFITIEHNYVEPRRTEIRNFLISKGYSYFKENQWDDDYVFFSKMSVEKNKKDLDSPSQATANLDFPSQATDKPFKICYITAIYGNYELTCKPYAEQTIKTDFICFTDNKDIEKNGWIIDTTPYHILNKSTIDTGNYINSISNNKHTFNIAKYYKQSFINIPILKDYDCIVWLDGTIKITNERTSEFIQEKIFKYKIIGWMHNWRCGKLKDEVDASNYERYTSTFWFNQHQPYQDIFKQYDEYIKDGYNDNFFSSHNNYGTIANIYNKENIGVWITCFVAFLNKDEETTNFLNQWYLETLKHTTQDQIGFPYSCYKTNILPYTLPDETIKGTNPHISTDLYEKLYHHI